MGALPRIAAVIYSRPKAPGKRASVIRVGSFSFYSIRARLASQVFFVDEKGERRYNIHKIPSKLFAKLFAFALMLLRKTMRAGYAKGRLFDEKDRDRCAVRQRRTVRIDIFCLWKSAAFFRRAEQFRAGAGRIGAVACAVRAGGARGIRRTPKARKFGNFDLSA